MEEIRIRVDCGSERGRVVRVGEVRISGPPSELTDTDADRLGYRAERWGDWVAKRLTKRLQNSDVGGLSYRGVDLHPLVYSLFSQLLRRRYGPLLMVLDRLSASRGVERVSIETSRSEAGLLQWLLARSRFQGLRIVPRARRRSRLSETIAVARRIARAALAPATMRFGMSKPVREDGSVVLFLPHSEVVEARCSSVVRELSERGHRPFLLTDRYPTRSCQAPRAYFGDLPITWRQLAGVFLYARALRRERLEALPKTLQGITAILVKQIAMSAYDYLVRAEEIGNVALKLRARSVVFTSHHAYGHAACIGAALAGVPSVWLQQAVMERRPHYGIGWKHATKYACWGEFDVPTLVRAEANPRDIHVIGSFYVDEVVRRIKAVDRSEVRRKLGIDGESFLVTFISWWLWFTFTADDKRRWLTMIAEAVKSLGEGFHLLVKLHPVESDLTLDESIVTAVLGRSRYTVMGPRSSLDEVLAASDLLIMPTSTVGVVAAAMNIPIAYINTDNDAMEYARRGLAHPVESARAIEEFAHRVRAGSFTRDPNAVRAYIDRNDGEAQRRLMGLISQLVAAPSLDGALEPLAESAVS